MCSHFIVGNKIFCFFIKQVFAFLDKGTFQGGGGGGGETRMKFSKILSEVDHKGGGPTDLEYLEA